MTHPPTRCDRKLFLDDNDRPMEVPAENIAKAVAWYHKNWERIAEAMPLTFEGVTMSEKWQRIFDYEMLPNYGEGGYKGRQAVAYVYSPIKRLVRALGP